MNCGINEESPALLYCAIMGTMTLFMLALGSAFSISMNADNEDDED